MTQHEIMVSLIEQYGDTRIEVSARLRNRKQAEFLIRALTALKEFLPEPLPPAEPVPEPPPTDGAPQ